jgi:excisionase family DNA binding protein
MSDELLTAAEAARRLGITATTLYDWLGRSRIGELEIRGRRVTIDYLQGGARGQGRIRIEAAEVARIRELMRVVPQVPVPRRPPVRAMSFPGITVPLGRPPGY